MTPSLKGNAFLLTAACGAGTSRCPTEPSRRAVKGEPHRRGSRGHLVGGAHLRVPVPPVCGDERMDKLAQAIAKVLTACRA